MCVEGGVLRGAHGCGERMCVVWDVCVCVGLYVCQVYHVGSSTISIHNRINTQRYLYTTYTPSTPHVHHQHHMYTINTTRTPSTPNNTYTTPHAHHIHTTYTPHIHHHHYSVTATSGRKAGGTGAQQSNLNNDMEQFLQDLEEDEEMRQRVALFKDQEALQRVCGCLCVWQGVLACVWGVFLLVCGVWCSGGGACGGVCICVYMCIYVCSLMLVSSPLTTGMPGRQ